MDSPRKVTLQQFINDGGEEAKFKSFDRNGDGVLDSDEIAAIYSNKPQKINSIATASPSFPQTEYGTLKEEKDLEDPIHQDPLQHIDAHNLGEMSWRAGFITKVYGIVSAQLMLTSGVCFLMMYQQMIHAAVIANLNAVMIASMVLSFGALLPLVCCYKKTYPTNFILLGIFTLGTSLNVGTCCAIYQEQGIGFLVFEAAAITGVIFMALTAYTFYSKRDFGFLRMYLFAALVGLMMWGFIAMLVGFDPGMMYSLFGVLLFSGYIVYDTWKLKAKLGPDDYILGAIELYLDIINLFLFVLDILGRSSNN